MPTPPPPVKPVHNLTHADLLLCGLPPHQAHVFYKLLQRVLAETDPACSPAIWSLVSKELLHPQHPHALHRFMYDCIYKDWDQQTKGPPPLWLPTQQIARQSNLGRLMEAHGRQLLGESYYSPIESYSAFQEFSVDHPEVYWPLLMKELSLKFSVHPDCIYRSPDVSRPHGTWLPGAVFNAAECCLLPKPSLGKTDSSKAIVWRNEGQTALHSMTYGELRAAASRIANALHLLGLEKMDVIAIVMPMNTQSIVIYLAIILAGFTVASIADSFSPPEIATRLSVSKTKAVFTQDVIVRGGKTFPLYSKVVAAKPPRTIVLPANEIDLQMNLQANDLSWNSFLHLVNHLSRPCDFEAVQQPIDAHTNILFTSGTSGEPKAVPYTHLQHIRLAAEMWAHVDVRANDVFIWPTSLGWMVGPMILNASFLTGATLGIFNGSPLIREFGEFMQDAGATNLGIIPSIVKVWRSSGCMDGLDWSKIRITISSGEASSPDDNLWLSARTFYSPLVEGCGGTELASGFIQGSLLQSQALGAFSTPSMATSFVILNEEGIPYPDDQPCVGEVALMPMLGESHMLLNADHNKIYYEGMPRHKGVVLRRHGDVFERMPGGYYRTNGRCDDIMNLGGIKVSALEIERACDKASTEIMETAAVAVPPYEGGPEQLVMFVVLTDAAGPNITAEHLKKILTKALQTHLNPLFKVSSVAIVKEFPRTATNKVLRRVLRSQALEARSQRSRL